MGMKEQDNNRLRSSGCMDLKSSMTTRLLPILCSANIGLVAMACVILLSMATVSAQQIGPATIELVDGSTLDGSVDSISQTGKVSGEGLPDEMNFQEVLAIRTNRKSQSSASMGVSLIPVSGGQVVVAAPQISEETVTFRSDVGIDTMPLQSVRAIVWKNSPSVAGSIKEPSTENDKVIVGTSDGERMVEGILEAIDATHVQINYKGKSRKIGIDKVNAVVTADLDLNGPGGATATVGFVDGSEVKGTISEFKDGQLKMVLAGDATVSMNSEMIMTIAVASDRILYLSDDDPVDVQEKALFAIQRPWKRDRSVEGNLIRLGPGPEPMAFKKGLGTQAFCRLEFSNSREFDRFNAMVGIDFETTGRGDCQVVVRGDGVELWSRRVRASDQPHELDIDISGYKRIALVVYPGEEFDLGDHIGWGNARFLKTK